MTPGAEVETTHHDYAGQPPRIERWTVGTVATGCPAHPGPWASVWTTATYQWPEWSAELHTTGTFHGCDGCAQLLPFGGHWQHTNDLTVIPGHTQPDLFDLLEATP